MPFGSDSRRRSTEYSTKLGGTCQSGSSGPWLPLRTMRKSSGSVLVLSSLASDEDRTAAEKAATIAPPPASAKGDLVVNARWNSGADVDVAVIAPDGSRISWMGGRNDVTVENSTATDRELLAVKSIKRGNYLVELTRNGQTSGSVSGSVDITVLGSKKTIPFNLTGPRSTVSRVTINLEERMDRIWMDGVACWVINANTGARSKTRCPKN